MPGKAKASFNPDRPQPVRGQSGVEPGGLAEGEDGAPGGGSDPLPTLGLGFPICALKDLVSVISDVMGKQTESHPATGAPRGQKTGSQLGPEAPPPGSQSPHEGGAGNFSDLKGGQGSRGLTWAHQLPGWGVQAP